MSANSICSHLSLTPVEMSAIIRVKRLRNVAAILSRYGNGASCDTCRSTIAELVLAAVAKPQAEPTAQTAGRGTGSIMLKSPASQITGAARQSLQTLTRKRGLYLRFRANGRVEVFGLQPAAAASLIDDLTDAGFPCDSPASNPTPPADSISAAAATRAPLFGLIESCLHLDSGGEFSSLVLTIGDQQEQLLTGTLSDCRQMARRVLAYFEMSRLPGQSFDHWLAALEAPGLHLRQVLAVDTLRLVSELDDYLAAQGDIDVTGSSVETTLKKPAIRSHSAAVVQSEGTRWTFHDVPAEELMNSMSADLKLKSR